MTSTDLATLEEMFKDRYSKDNERYQKLAEGFDPAIVVHPLPPPPQWNNYSNRGANRYGGSNGYRGNYRGGYNNHRGGGNNYNNGNRKRRYDDRS